MSAAVTVFVGPTVTVADARAVLDADYRPPAARGDVYRAAQKRPIAIGIVDGYFERVLSVWHKEILWAMAQGIHVFGSASIGALRAAELAPFGMVGVGDVFAALRSRALEDDDEVAVAHAPVELGYRALSEAMVNLRATLVRAEAEKIISPSTRAALERLGKAEFYPDRSYPMLLRRGREASLPEVELGALAAWLPTGRIDQKRDDALAMLRRLRALVADPPPTLVVRYHFEHTDAWETVRKQLGPRPDAER
jgi:hypothetical protein